MKHKILVTALLFSVSATAQEYQSISSFGGSNTKFNTEDLNRYYLTSKYYFNKKSTIGPLDQFSYINTMGNISAAYLQSENLLSDDSQFTSVSAEVFIDQFVIGGSFGHVDAPDFAINNYSAFLGYLFSDNLLFSTSVHKTEGVDETFTFLAKYNHQINKTDYIGFSATTDDEIDNKSISATYFRSLNENQYLKVAVEYNDHEFGGDYWHAKGEYYFNDYTSAFLQYQNNDIQTFGAKHFFNNYLALSASYTYTDNSDDLEIINIKLHVQL